MLQATIYIHDEINAEILGIADKHANELYDDYGLYKKGCFFTLPYKLKKWDGKVRLFSKYGKTYTFLLPKIVKKLNKWGYKLRLKDNRIRFEPPSVVVVNDYFKHILNNENQPTLLRDYQVEAVQTIIDNNGGIVLAGTSTGKTLMAATLTKIYGDLGYRVITIVPNASLVKQSSEECQRWELDVGRFDGKVKDLHTKHLVSTWQSLQNVGILLEQFDVIIVDECQTAQSNTLFNLINQHGKNSKVRVGLTGSLPKEELELLNVKIVLGKIIYEIPADVLITDGVLSSININIEILHENFDADYFPDYASEISYLHTNKERLLYIENRLLELRQQPLGNTLFLANKAVGKKIFKSVSKNNSNVYFLSGDDDPDERALIYEKFKTENNILLIANFQIAGVGLSIDRIFHLAYLDIGKSFIRVIQGVGRILRRNESLQKTHGEIHDFTSSLKNATQQTKQRIKYYKEANYPYNKKIIKYKVIDDVDLLEVD